MNKSLLFAGLMTVSVLSYAQEWCEVPELSYVYSYEHYENDEQTLTYVIDYVDANNVKKSLYLGEIGSDSTFYKSDKVKHYVDFAKNAVLTGKKFHVLLKNCNFSAEERPTIKGISLGYEAGSTKPYLL